MSVLPHLSTSDRVWLSGADELFYLQFAAATARAGSARLLDPAQVAPRPTVYAAAPLLPGIAIARAFGLEPVRIGLVWRVWAGALVGLAWFLLLNSLLGGPWLALGASIFLMSDAGVTYGWLGLKNYAGAASLTQWRIVNPALTLPFLLAYLLFLRRAAASPTKGRVLAASAAFGALFYSYFFWWTTAGLALLLSAALDAPRRKTYLTIAAFGAAVGLPALILQSLDRSGLSADYFRRVGVLAALTPMPGLQLPKLALAMTAACFWTVRRRPELLGLWTVAAAGLLLANEHLITGLWIGNDHWAYAWGHALSCLVLVLTLEQASRLRYGYRLFGILCAAHFVTGLGIRTAEARAPGEAARYNAAYRSYRPHPGASKSVVYGPREAVDLAVLLDDRRPLFSYASILSPSIGDEELAHRLALNAYLMKTPRAALLRDREILLGGYSLGGADLGAAYDAVKKDPAAWRRRFGVSNPVN